LHCGSGPPGSHVDGSAFVCIDLEAPYEAASPTNDNLYRVPLIDPVINLTATTAEDVDQDYDLVYTSSIFPLIVTEPDEPAFPIISISDTTDIGPTWTPEPGTDPDSTWPQVRFIFYNMSEYSSGFSFKAHFVKDYDDSSYWYSVPETYSVTVPANDSITIECKPSLHEEMPMGQTDLVVEWYEGYEAVGIANDILGGTFILYKCGDASGDGSINVSDAVYIINFAFSGGEAPDPYVSGDVNCDETVNISDAVYIINYAFSGGNFPCDVNGDSIPDC